MRINLTKNYKITSYHQPIINLFFLQLCSGGSVTDLIQTLKRSNDRLPEMLIAFILKETMDVSFFPLLSFSSSSLLSCFLLFLSE